VRQAFSGQELVQDSDDEPAASPANKPRLLLIATMPWMFPARLAGAFREVGFHVEAVCQLLSALSYRTKGWPSVYCPSITPTPLSPLLLRGELVRPSVPRLAYCPQAESLGVLFLSGVYVDNPKKNGPSAHAPGPSLENQLAVRVVA